MDSLPLFLCIFLICLSLATAPNSTNVRKARWVNRSKKITDVPDSNDYLRPSKVICKNEDENAMLSPLALGALAGVHRKKGETREEALRREGKAGEEDASIFTPQKHMLRFNKKYYKIRDQLFFQNDGETLRFQFQENATSDATIRGEDWDDEYIFAYGQLSWAGQYSEKIGGVGHSINSQHYPAEMQMVHYRASDETIEKAWKKNGIVITSTLFRLTGEGSPALSPILGNAPYVAQPGPLKLLHAPVNFKQLMPLGDGYFEYVGSNTFSPCKDNVRRIVFETPIEVDDAQLFDLQYLVYDDGKKTPMKNNFATKKRLNGRHITYNSEGYKLTKTLKLLQKERPSHAAGNLHRKP